MKISLPNLGLLFSILTTATVTFAAPPPHPTDICVRNFFPEGTSLNPCASDTIRFAEVVSAMNPDDGVCTKIYAESYCDSSPKEFRHVETVDGRIICTVHFHQIGIAEYCYSNPKIFSWAKGK